MDMLVAICGSKALAQGTAPVAGSELVAVGVTVTQLTDVVKGWSVKKKILGHDIYNDKNEKVGSIDDLIVGPDKASSFLIVGAGGFLGIDRHDVAIPVKQIQEKDGKFVLPGATKEVVKAMPEFRYAK
jgi:sporulation protein YlmC with PRC-barrel domain